MNLASPLALLLGLLAVPLVALYFLRVRRRRVTVPSLLPWHALQQRDRLATPFQRFRRHLLLWLQLLLLASLVGAAARPWVPSEEAPWRSMVLVMDVSASMGARDEAPDRLTVAATHASDLVDRLGPADEAMVIAAGPRTEVVLPFTRDRARLRQALGGLRATEAAGGLRDAVQMALALARTRPDVEVVVLSDGGSDDLTGLTTGGVRLRHVPVGRSSDNAGIVALDVRRHPADALGSQLFVTVASYGPRPVDATMEVTLDDRLIGLRTETLAPEVPVSLVFDVPAGPGAVLRARVRADGDLLAADDEAFAVVDPGGARRLLLVGGDALTVRALAADPRFTLQRVTSSALTPELLAAHDAILFTGAVPDGVDGLSYAVLGPQPGGPVQLGARIEAPAVTQWQRTHPLLRFVDLEAVTIAAARQVRDPGGLTPIVQGDTGPLILAGRRAGGRVVQLTFDPLHSDLPMRVAWPVFLLNTAGWLTGEADEGQARQTSTGTPWIRRLPDGVEQATVLGPAGTRTVTVDDGILRFDRTDHVGLYTVRAKGVEARFAANLLSDRESRIAPRVGLDLGDDAAGDALARQARGRHELWRPLLLLALLILLAEWAVYSRGRTA